jgi:hypothetical protein
MEPSTLFTSYRVRFAIGFALVLIALILIVIAYT